MRARWLVAGAVPGTSLADGSVLRRKPLLAEITAAETIEVNRDGVTDLWWVGRARRRSP